jgi:hypothetical protein
MNNSASSIKELPDDPIWYSTWHQPVIANNELYAAVSYSISRIKAQNYLDIDSLILTKSGNTIFAKTQHFDNGNDQNYDVRTIDDITVYGYRRDELVNLNSNISINAFTSYKSYVVSPSIKNKLTALSTNKFKVVLMYDGISKNIAQESLLTLLTKFLTYVTSLSTILDFIDKSVDRFINFVRYHNESINAYTLRDSFTYIEKSLQCIINIKKEDKYKIPTISKTSGTFKQLGWDNKQSVILLNKKFELLKYELQDLINNHNNIYQLTIHH